MKSPISGLVCVLCTVSPYHWRIGEWQRLKYHLYLFCSKVFQGSSCLFFFLWNKLLFHRLFNIKMVQSLVGVGMMGVMLGGIGLQFCRDNFLSTPHCERLLLQGKDYRTKEVKPVDWCLAYIDIGRRVCICSLHALFDWQLRNHGLLASLNLVPTQNMAGRCCQL